MRGEFFLVGPTAVGKSELAVEVAEHFGAEILNGDAFQIYRGLDILTAKPEATARRRVEHHLLNVVDLAETMSAVRFREIALAALGRIHARGKAALIVGGSGLYGRALLRGFDDAPPPNPSLRQELAALSGAELAARLLRLDPKLASRTDLKNPRRVIRAIEIAEGTTTVIPSEVEESCRENFKVTQRDPSTPKASGARDEANVGRGVFLVRDRNDLYARINERVLAMFRNGVEQEVAALKQIGLTGGQALGLREIQKLLAGEISREDCIGRVQQATRRYAKRQLTWFRHQTNFPQLNLTALSHREAVSAIRRAIAQE